MATMETDGILLLQRFNGFVLGAVRRQQYYYVMLFIKIISYELSNSYAMLLLLYMYLSYIEYGTQPLHRLCVFY